MLLKLQSWWSNHYNLPIKDPILQNYTLEELLYEYHDKIERSRADRALEAELDEEADVSKLKENLDWAEEEERKELEELRKQQEQAEENIGITREDEEWMRKQAREEFGDDIDEDLDINFEE